MVEWEEICAAMLAMHDFMYKGGLHDVKHRGVEGAACLAMETPENADSAEELRPALATELLVGIPPSETEKLGIHNRTRLLPPVPAAVPCS